MLFKRKTEARPGRASPDARARPSAAFFLAVVLLLLAACSGKQVPPARSIILISIDTLRPDHLGAYGYGPETSPRIDAFREDAVLFETAIAHAPSTLMSHASLLTSLIPQHHGASHGHSKALPDEVTTLAEVLGESGFATGAFTGGGQMSAGYGLDQGFDLYADDGGDFDEVARRGLSWIDEQGDGPFFLFLHTYEVHHPYEPRPDLLALFEDGYDGHFPDHISVELLQRINRKEVAFFQEDLAHIEAAYDAEIRSMDTAFGELVEGLRERGLYEDSLIVFTSDHGEEFGERDSVGWHSHTLFDELLRVPLLVKYPEGEHAGERVVHQVRLSDVAPTVVEAAGGEPPTDFEGRSLADALEGRHDDASRPAVAQIDVKDDRYLPALRMGGWKWFSGRLFDLAEDPGETSNLAPLQPERAAQMLEVLEKTVAARPKASGGEAELDDETRKRLEALGYVE